MGVATAALEKNECRLCWSIQRENDPSPRMEEHPHITDNNPEDASDIRNARPA